MTFDYHETRRAVLDGLSGIGRKIDVSAAESKMSAAQRKHRRGRNIMTDEVWQYRLLAGGSLVVEIAYGWFIEHPLFGVTVYCVGELAPDAEQLDHSLSGCFHDVPSLLGRVATLEAGGRDRIAALAQPENPAPDAPNTSAGS